MRNLLRADFKRVVKDKLLLVIGILVVAFGVLTPALYALIFSDPELFPPEAVSTIISAKAQFFQSFSLSNNVGLIVPILLIIILCKDFSFGTVRNKIISGKSRTAVFLSLFTVCTVTVLAVMLINAFLTLGASLAFFDYQSDPFKASDFWYFLESLGFEILILILVSTIISWLCAATKNTGMAIVFYAVIIFALAMLSAITQIAGMALEEANNQGIAYKIVQFINRINITTAGTYIGVSDSYSLKDVLYLTLPSLTGIALFLWLGIFKFNKKDLK